VSIARHHSTEERPAERGRAFGRAQAATVAHTVATYRRIFLVDRGLGPAELEARGREVEARVRAFRPGLADEIEGIAAGAREPPEVVFAINARTELLAGGVLAGGPMGECSTVALLDPAGADALLAQNWDFHPDLAGSRVVWTIDRPDGPRLTTFTESGLLGKVGVSADGVALAINFLASDRDGGLAGVPIHVLCRTLLEEARTVQDARTLLAATPVSASVSMTVAGRDAGGGLTALAFELWPGGMAEVTVEPDSGWIAHTNHFLGAIAARDVLVDSSDGASTRDRLRQLTDALEDGSAADAAQVAELLSSRGAPGLEPIYRIDDGQLPWLARCATLATLAFEVPSGRMWLRGDGGPDAPLQRVA
jgi:isopenicillin-N N-acyltransferase like protein